MSRFIRFFLGTPERILSILTVVAALAAVEHFNPGVVEASVAGAVGGILNGLWIAICPFIGPVAALVLAFYGLWIILNAARRR